MKAKTSAMIGSAFSDITERRWEQSSDYPGAEYMLSTLRHDGETSRLYRVFAEYGIVDRVKNSKEYSSRMLLCLSCEDKLYMANMAYIVNQEPSTLWRASWDLVDVVGPGEIEIRNH